MSTTGLPEGGSEKKLSPEEIEYKKKLRDTLLDVSREFLEEHRAEILKRAEERLAFEASLSK